MMLARTGGSASGGTTTASGGVTSDGGKASGGITSSGGGSGVGGETGGGGGAAPTLPSLAEGWNRFDPGGETLCSLGTPYAFFARPGKVNKLIVDFIGGGACWDEVTCNKPNDYFYAEVESVPFRFAIPTDNVPHGIYDHTRAENPFADWYHVVVPYCTGDLHWGDAVVTYAEGTANEVTINHKGAVNVRTVLKWVYDNFSAPEQILVTGCSAGSYGSALWSADVMNHYPNAEVFQLGDSGAGIMPEGFFTDSWNAKAAFPAYIPELDPSKVDIQTMMMPDLYAGIANHFPKQKMSQYSAIRDEEQVYYFIDVGGADAQEFSRLLQASWAEIEQRAPNFASFLAPGEQHGILSDDNFYTVRSNGVALIDWLRSMVEKTSFGSVACQGAECEEPTP